MEYFRTTAYVLARTPYPHRYVKLGVSKTGVYLDRVHSAEEVHIALVAFLAMVGNIEHNGIVVLKLLHYLGHDRVVVEYGIIVVGKYLTLAGVEIWLEFLVVVAVEVLAIPWRALTICHMLTQKMEYDEIVFAVLSL